MERKGLVEGIGVNDGKNGEEVPMGTVERRGEGFGERVEKREGLREGLKEGKVSSPTPEVLPL